MGEGRVSVGARIRMTKGYRGVEGVISEKTDSKFEFYVVALDNAIHLVAGPSFAILSLSKQCLPIRLIRRYFPRCKIASGLFHRFRPLAQSIRQSIPQYANTCLNQSRLRLTRVSGRRLLSSDP